MKWLVIIAILIVVAGALWLRTMRQVPAGTPDRPHRLDDSVTLPDDAPGAAHETGAAGPTGPDPDVDPPPSAARESA